MKFPAIVVLFFSLILINTGFSKVAKPNPQVKKPVQFDKVEVEQLKKKLLKSFSISLSKTELSRLKKLVLSEGGKSVPALIEIMKNGKYPENNRWAATFLLGRIMGQQASPFLVKFLKHPNWVMRMASLKTLLALKDHRFGVRYGHALQDPSLIVRKQALENIRTLSIRKAAPMVWAMLYDKKNYYSGKSQGKKRTNLIRDAIRTVGDLRFAKAREPLFTMMQKKRYKDIHEDIDYSLKKLTGKNSPDGNIASKKRFWRKVALEYTTI